MRARDLMTPNPVVITPDEPVSRAAEVMREREIGMLPVVDDPRRMHLVGVITDRDIAVRCVASMHIPACRVALHMTRDNLHTVAPDDDAREAVAVMRHDQVRRIPVVSEGGHLEGIIAQADLARKLGATDPVAVEKVLESISAPSH